MITVRCRDAEICLDDFPRPPLSEVARARTFCRPTNFGVKKIKKILKQQSSKMLLDVGRKGLVNPEV